MHNKNSQLQDIQINNKTVERVDEQIHSQQTICIKPRYEANQKDKNATKKKEICDFPQKIKFLTIKRRGLGKI